MYEVEDFIECGICECLLFPGDLVMDVVGYGEVCPQCVRDLVKGPPVLYH